MEISTFQGHYQVWIDGKSELDNQDPKPLPAGSFGIWFGMPLTGNKTTIIYTDAISICGLSALFTSIPAPAPVP
jgi:hypothetical protein